jgi:hypothetical protein
LGTSLHQIEILAVCCFSTIHGGGKRQVVHQTGLLLWFAYRIANAGMRDEISTFCAQRYYCVGRLCARRLKIIRGVRFAAVGWAAAQIAASQHFNSACILRAGLAASAN